MPAWMKYLLGPLGLTIALAFYAYRTETVRLPKLVTLLEKAQEETKQADKDKDEALANLRKGYEAREKALRKRLNAWMARHSREKTRRIFFQTECSALARKHGEEEPKMPSEISATSYQHRPLPADPEPDDFKDDDELPPVP